MSAIDNNRIIKNFISLIILQGGRYLLPLILIPFLIRALGMQTFGSWVFAVSFVAIFRTFVNYGFDMTATRAVSIHRDDKIFLSELYTTVIITRLTILVFSCLVLFGLGLMFTNIWNVILLAQLSMLVLIGEALFPIWLFQGMESMGTITQLRLGYRALFVSCVILVVREPHDVLLIPIIEGTGSLLAGLIALYLAYSRYELIFRWPRYSFFKSQIRDGASIFLSYVAVHFYTTINTVLLGIIQNNVAVAHFSIAEKVYSAIRGMLSPVVQALFPSLSRLYVADQHAFRRTARKIAIGFFITLVGLAVLTYFLADALILLIAGQPDPMSTQVLQIMAVTLIFALSTLLSSLLVIQKRGNTLMLITFSTMTVNLIIVYPLLHYYGVIGMAIAFLVTQVFQTVLQLNASVKLLSLSTSQVITDAHLYEKEKGHENE